MWNSDNQTNKQTKITYTQGTRYNVIVESL